MHINELKINAIATQICRQCLTPHIVFQMTNMSTTPTESAAAASAVLPALNEMWDDSAKIIKGKADDGVDA